MPRIARVVIPNTPHHVTQRGNRRQRTFFEEADYKAYLTLLGRFCAHYGTEIWCFCLMPNHVHLIAAPGEADALAAAIGRTHEAYTRMINARFGWKGYLWQGRFHSFPMDTAYLVDCARYVLMNPVKAGLARSVVDWRWSSALAHLGRASDGITTVEPLARIVDDWGNLLNGAPMDTGLHEKLSRHGRTGRPLGSLAFVENLEKATGRRLLPKRPGRRPAKPLAK